MQRNVYLKKKPLDQARQEFLDAFDWPALAGEESLPTVEALGRITARPVHAVYSSPSYFGAAMDGVAVRAADSFGADDEHPVLLTVDEQAFFVNTGNPLPPDTDAVVMIEEVYQPRDDVVELRSAAFPWQHVRKVGEDMVAGDMMVPRHHRLGAADLAALVAAGVFAVPVFKIPRVAIIPTGGELWDWRQAQKEPPPQGAIIETNSILLANLVRETGAEPVLLERCPDEPEQIKKALEQALESPAQMVVINAGASAGTRDYTSKVISQLGEVMVHGVTVMPGKPTILGRVRGKPVVGSPGYPVSAWVCFDQFIAPALALMQGQSPPRRQELEVVTARRLPSKLGQEEFLRVHLGRVGDQVVAAPLKRGAGALTSLTRAEGILRIPSQSDGLEEGTRVKAELLVSRQALERTLVVVGSHDITLDLLADHLRRRETGVNLCSSHLGSLAGLIAIREGRCHLGGTHLLDPETGEYNQSYIQRYLPEVPVRLVTLALRQQGFMVAPGNPKGIREFADLLREDVTMVNRQPGSGTRVLLDYHLQRLGLDPAGIRGYDHDEYTHTAVAVQVLAGGADVGLGILAAARALGLDFIPLMIERYDLCIPRAFLDDPRIQALLQTLEDPEFQQAVEELGGYDVGPMGQVAWES